MDKRRRSGNPEAPSLFPRPHAAAPAAHASLTRRKRGRMDSPWPRSVKTTSTTLRFAHLVPYVSHPGLSHMLMGRGQDPNLDKGER